MKTLVIFPERSAMWVNGEALCNARLPALDFRFAYGLTEAAQRISGAEIVLSFVLDDACVARADALRWVQSLGAGVDGLARVRALRGVVVTAAPGLHGSAVSEAALAMMLALSRHLPAFVRDQDSRRWSPRLSVLLAGGTVGIVGTGRIACALAAKCKALSMRVVGFSATPRAMAHFDAVLPRADLIAEAARLDYVVLLTSFDASARALANAALFTAMKETAYLINLGRGGLVDEEALVKALQQGAIAGAGLDVFVEEPLPTDHPFWTLPNLLMTPHVAGRREGYFADLLEVFAENLKAYRVGKPMPTQVSF